MIERKSYEKGRKRRKEEREQERMRRRSQRRKGSGAIKGDRKRKISRRKWEKEKGEGSPAREPEIEPLQVLSEVGFPQSLLRIIGCANSEANTHSTGWGRKEIGRKRGGGGRGRGEEKKKKEE